MIFIQAAVSGRSLSTAIDGRIDFMVISGGILVQQAARIVPKPIMLMQLRD